MKTIFLSSSLAFFNDSSFKNGLAIDFIKLILEEQIAKDRASSLEVYFNKHFYPSYNLKQSQR